MSTGPELAFFYICGLLAAVEHDYINHALIDVLADTRIGLLDNAESEPAEFILNNKHTLLSMRRPLATAAVCAAADAAVARAPRERHRAQMLPTALDPGTESVRTWVRMLGTRILSLGNWESGTGISELGNQDSETLEPGFWNWDSELGNQEIRNW